MSDKVSKLKTYCGQLKFLLTKIPSHSEVDDIEELVDELKEESDLSPLDAKPILNINNEIRKALAKPEAIPTDEAKYVERAERVTNRIIRTFNFSGTEKRLEGEALKRQWAKRNAMGRGELDPPRYDDKGNLFFGIIDGRLYEAGKKVNGIRDGFLYYNGNRYNGWHDDGFYYQSGLRHTGARLTYNEIILFENGKEVGRQPRSDIEDSE